MKITLPFSILSSLVISIVLGFFLYAFIDKLRIDYLCPVQVEGGGCYTKDWEFISIWVTSLVGSLMAIISISLVSLFQPKQRYKSAVTMLLVGCIVAIPFALFTQSIITYLVTVISGCLVVLIIKSLTSHLKGNA